jgi:hypothetical protein
MKIYFSRITADHWCAKNNLEKAAHKLAREMDRRILTQDQVPAYKKEFQEKINKLNQEYHRCKPLELDIHSAYDDRGDIDFYISSVFNLCLFLAKE